MIDRSLKKFFRIRHVFPLVFAVATIVLSGCIFEQKTKKVFCPAPADANAVMASLDQRQVSAFKAVGTASMRWVEEGRKNRQSFPVRLWVDPNAGLCLYGDIFFNASALRMGINHQNFWFCLKPSLDACFWGQRRQIGVYPDSGQPFEAMAPMGEYLLKALGLSEIYGDEYNSKWQIVSAEENAVFIENNLHTRRIEVDSCTGNLLSVQNISHRGGSEWRVELTDYKKIDEGFSFAHKLSLGHTNSGSDMILNLKFDNAEVKEFNDAQRDFLFKRPDEQNYKHVLRMLDGKFYRTK